MKAIILFLSPLIFLIFICSCISSKGPDVDIKYQRKYDVAIKYYNENKFDSAYFKFVNIYNSLHSFEYAYRDPRREKLFNFYNKVLKFGKDSEDKYKILLIDKCLDAIDNKNFDLAHTYEKYIPFYSTFENTHDYILEDSLNYSFGFRLFNDLEYNQTILFFSKIKYKKAKEDLIIPILIEIGNNAIEKNDIDFAVKAIGFILKEYWGNKKYFSEIDNLGTKIDSLRNINELRRFKETQFEREGLEFIIKSAARWSLDNDLIQPDKGFYYYSLDVIVINISNKVNYITPSGFNLTDDNEFKYLVSFFHKEPDLKNCYLQPGEKTRGYLTFEILNNVKNLKLSYSFW